MLRTQKFKNTELIGVGWVGDPFPPLCKVCYHLVTHCIQALGSSLFDVQMGIVRTHGEADGLGQEPTGDQESSILQDFLGPCANVSIVS